MKLTPSQFLKKHNAALIELLFQAIRWPAPARIQDGILILREIEALPGFDAPALTLHTLLGQSGLRFKLDNESKYKWHCELGGVEFIATLTPDQLDMLELHVACTTATQCARHAAALDIDRTERRIKHEAARDLETALLTRLAVAFNEGQHFGGNVFVSEVVLSTVEPALIASIIDRDSVEAHFHRKGVMLRSTRKATKYPGALEGKIENIKFRMLPTDAENEYVIKLRGSSRV